MVSTMVESDRPGTGTLSIAGLVLTMLHSGKIASRVSQTEEFGFAVCMCGKRQLIPSVLSRGRRPFQGLRRTDHTSADTLVMTAAMASRAGGSSITMGDSMASCSIYVPSRKAESWWRPGASATGARFKVGAGSSVPSSRPGQAVPSFTTHAIAIAVEMAAVTGIPGSDRRRTCRTGLRAIGEFAPAGHGE